MSLDLIYEEMGNQIRDLMEAESPWDIQVYGKGMLANPTPPSIDIYLADPSNDSETGGFGAAAEDTAEGYWINVRCRVSTTDLESQQRVLTALRDQSSTMCLTDAIDADPTLGGYAHDVALDAISGYALFPTIDGGAVHIGILWRFLVLPAFS